MNMFIGKVIELMYMIKIISLYTIKIKQQLTKVISMIIKGSGYGV